MQGLNNPLLNCNLCPRACGVDRTSGQRGYCRVGDKIVVAHWGPHYGEEPPISGRSGSGTIFFSFCNLRCIFCQNWQISQEGMGDEISQGALCDIFLELEQAGCHNINLVSPTPYVPFIVAAIQDSRRRGLRLPILYNTNAYETVETLRMLDGLIDIYLPDFKYWNAKVAHKLSGIPEEKPYGEYAAAAIAEMKRQVGDLVVEDGIASRGILIRHLVLPGGLAGSKEIFRWIAQNLGNQTYISLMSQYHPIHKAHTVPLLRRKINAREYDDATQCLVDLGFSNVFVQHTESSELFIPDFEEEEPFEEKGGREKDGV